MRNNSTFINEEDIPKLVEACGQEIRGFLDLLGNSDENLFLSQVNNNQASQLKVEPGIFENVRQFKDSPHEFSNDKLIERGAHYERALDNPVRIELRRIEGVSGAAQIAVRGISGDYRLEVLRRIKAEPVFKNSRYYVRMSGNASFEINSEGVNKALPIKYLRHHWKYVLNQIKYTPGDYIDSSKTGTIIAADGDGTTLAGPSLSKAPTLKTSVAYEALLQYLKGGGMYIVISGNHLLRTVTRIKDFVPYEVINRLLIVANGGANMVHFNQDGQVFELEDYRQNGLRVHASDSKTDPLDLIYIGDDGRLNGNDREAFNEVGPERSILVAKDKTDDIIPSLVDKHIGGLEAGTKKVLEFINGWVAKNPKQLVFTPNNIQQMIEFALR